MKELYKIKYVPLWNNWGLYIFVDFAKDVAPKMHLWDIKKCIEFLDQNGHAEALLMDFLKHLTAVTMIYLLLAVLVENHLHLFKAISMKEHRGSMWMVH